MFTIFHLLDLMLPVAGLVYGAQSGFERGGLWGGIAGGLLGGASGILVSRLILHVPLALVARSLAKRPTADLKSELHSAECVAPNVVLLELQRRGAVGDEDLSIVFDMLVDVSLPCRTSGLAALASAYPDLVARIPDYRPEPLDDEARSAVLRLRQECLGAAREGAAAVLATLEAHATGDAPRAVRAGRAAEVIRQAGRYRWVGLYDVTEHEIAVIAWSGPTAPSHPRFPRSHGLNGAAVESRRPVVVQDVSKDSRYLPTLGDTRGEMIMPVTDQAGTVVGTIDVESAEVNAFRDQDEVLLEKCARALRPLWENDSPRAARSARSWPGTD